MISSLSSSSSAATVRVEKATSDLLIGPDWTMNMGICDSINSNHWEAKDVVKAVKKRLQHKNPTVQLLALTLLETMVKNCGDYVHLQIAEKNVLQEMVKIVKKKSHTHVRDKILVLIDSWQEAFGGAGGKYPQYYWAYEELRRYGIGFPPRSSDTAPIITPPVTHSTVRPAQAGYGMPINSSTRLDEAMAAEMETLSVSSINSMRDVLDLLADMLQAVNPSDRESVKDEVIVDLVNQCRSNQKKLMQMLTTTGDEELLVQGLELNDNLQIVLAKNDAISSGSPLPTPSTSFLRAEEPQLPSRASSANSSAAPVAAAASKGQVQEDEEEEEDDFAQLARRHSKTKSTSHDMSTGSSGSVTPTSTFTDAASSSAPNSCTALALPDPPSSVKTTKDQDMIDFLSITLSTMGTTSPRSPYSQQSSSENFHQAGASQTVPNYPSQPPHGNQGQVPFSSYVVPWAQTQPQPQPQPQPQSYPQPLSQPETQPQTQPQPRSYAHYQPYNQRHLPREQPQAQAQAQPQYALPPPPWAATPGYYSNQNYLSSTSYMSSAPRTNAAPSYASSLLESGPSPSFNSFAATSINGETRVSGSDQRTTAAPAAQKAAFVPSYRLFEDLNVLGNGDGRLKMTNNGYNAAGPSTQSMVGGRK